MAENPAYTFGSAEGVAAVICAITTIQAGSRWPWTLLHSHVDAVRAALTEAAATRCPAICSGCQQSCWRATTADLAAQLPTTHLDMQDMWEWVLDRDAICSVLQALVGAWDHECAQHQTGCPQECWRFTAGHLAGVIAESVGVPWI